MILFSVFSLSFPQKTDRITSLKWTAAFFPPLHLWQLVRRTHLTFFQGRPGGYKSLAACCGPLRCSVAMATNREQQVGHMTGFPPAVYPFPFNSMRSHSPFDLLANSSLFGRFGADLPKEMAALCKSFFLTVCLPLFLPLIYHLCLSRKCSYCLTCNHFLHFRQVPLNNFTGKWNMQLFQLHFIMCNFVQKLETPASVCDI